MSLGTRGIQPMAKVRRPKPAANEPEGPNEPHHHESVFPEKWVRRMPVLAAISAFLLAFAAIGHVVGGIGELAQFTEDMFRKPVVPAVSAPVAPPKPSDPLTMALLDSETVPLDGYQMTGTATLPKNFQQGPLLPGGAKTRVVLQAADANRVVQIDRVAVEVTHMARPAQLAANYTVDPSRQSGFGAAQPRQFYVQLAAGTTNVFYIGDNNTSEPTSASNVLPKKEFPLLILDAQAGLQETLDFNLVASEPGLYEVRFHTFAASAGHEYSLLSKPIYIVRN
jgi:hypothetical protein